MPNGIFDLLSSLRLKSLFTKQPHKTSQRRHRSRGRLLRGVEALERREMMTAVPAYVSFESPTNLAALDEAFAQFDVQQLSP